MVKHENDSDNINELTKSNNHLKEQQQEYKSLLNQTMESLENNSIKIDSLTKVNYIKLMFFNLYRIKLNHSLNKLFII